MTAMTPDEHEAEQAEFHQWLDHEEQLAEYLRIHRPEPEPPEQWTEWDDLNERVLDGAYDDVIFPEHEPGNTGRCTRCGDLVRRTASNPYGWVRINRPDLGVCGENAQGRRISHVGYIEVHG